MLIVASPRRHPSIDRPLQSTLKSARPWKRSRYPLVRRLNESVGRSPGWRQRWNQTGAAAATGRRATVNTHAGGSADAGSSGIAMSLDNATSEMR